MFWAWADWAAVMHRVRVAAAGSAVIVRLTRGLRVNETAMLFSWSRRGLYAAYRLAGMGIGTPDRIHLSRTVIK
ncbi:hypothetical protein GCM10023195_62070 [Actinoallomurus liliacearum]|uniref:Uncharacterized protein n=1 Tax=Actinoallomurus liliacearum TaxID=1080073 RepID=A0ABP8TR81_9ACTN